MDIFEFLIKLEGMKLKPYRDQGGHLTIGVGHLITREERRAERVFIGDVAVMYSGGISEHDAIELLGYDIRKCEKVIEHSVKVQISENERTALLSFCFNVGTNAFKDSHLLRHLNKGKKRKIPSDLMKWIYVSSHIDKNLVKRRLQEVLMWVGYFNEKDEEGKDA